MADKLNSSIEYLLQCLAEYKSIIESGDCNTCEIANTCKYKPKLGELVRFNCMFYERKDETYG